MAAAEQTWTFVGYWSGDYECGCWAVRPKDLPPEVRQTTLIDRSPFHRGHRNLYPDDLIHSVVVAAVGEAQASRDWHGRWTVTIRFEPDAETMS